MILRGNARRSQHQLNVFHRHPSRRCVNDGAKQQKHFRWFRLAPSRWSLWRLRCARSLSLSMCGKEKLVPFASGVLEIKHPSSEAGLCCACNDHSMFYSRMGSKKMGESKRLLSTVPPQVFGLVAIIIILGAFSHFYNEYQEDYFSRLASSEARLEHWARNCGPSVARLGIVDCDREWGLAHGSPRLQAISAVVWHIFSVDLNPISWIGCGAGSYCRAKVSTLFDFGLGTSMFVIPIVMVGVAVFVARVCINRYILGESSRDVMYVRDRPEYPGIAPYVYQGDMRHRGGFVEDA